MTFTPGPANLTSMNNAAASGFRRAAPYLLGLGAGGVSIMLVGLAFSAALYAFLPKIMPVMKIFGSLFIIYIIFITIRPKKHEEGGKKSGAGFVFGFLFQFINVKAILGGITMMSSYILPHYSAFPGGVIFAFSQASLGFISNVCWAALGAALSRLFFRRPILVKTVMSLLLAYCAVTILL
jgi:threonine/homoserine/homoserine lactone efflux protein